MSKIKTTFKKKWDLLENKDIIFISAIIFAVIMQIKNMNTIPIVSDYFAFRQAQTAITIQDYVNHGYSLFNYRTPVFGEPWAVPFEFPIYQTSVYIVLWLFRLGPESISFVARSVSLLYFFATAFMIYVLVKKYFTNSNIARVSTVFFLLCPFNIIWGKSVLPDYCSVFFALLYTFFILKFLEYPKIHFMILGVLTGSLSYLSKSTSMFPIIILLAVVILKKIYDDFICDFSIEKIKVTLKLKYKFYLLLFLMCIIPVLVYYPWQIYSDHIKESSPLTSWLTSQNLKSWNFGTAEQKFSFKNWELIFGRLNSYFLPFSLPILLLIFPFLFEKEKKSILILGALGFSSFLTIFCLFNLYYIHDYYLIAVTPFLSVICGFVLYQIWKLLSKSNFFIIILSVFFTFLMFITPINTYLKKSQDSPPITVLIADYLQQTTAPDEYIIITDQTWSSEQLFAANRRGMMLNEGTAAEEDILKMLEDSHYTTIVSSKPENYPYLFDSFDSVVLEKYIQTQNEDAYIYTILRDQNEKNNLLSNRTSSILVPSEDFSYGVEMEYSNENDCFLNIPAESGYIYFDIIPGTTPSYVDIQFSKKIDLLSFQLIGMIDQQTPIVLSNCLIVNSNKLLISIPESADQYQYIGLAFGQGNYNIAEIILYS